MREKTRKWLHGLGSAGIGGLATAFTSALGVQGAQLVGIDIATLDGGQLGIITLFGGLISMAAYLKQSPLPPINGDTEILKKEDL